MKINNLMRFICPFCLSPSLLGRVGVGLLFFLFTACSDADPPSELGSIMFTSNFDCDIRLFYSSNGEQFVRTQYEVGKAPAVVKMKSSGVFIVHAVRNGSDKTVNEPIVYVNGNLEHYIEF